MLHSEVLPFVVEYPIVLTIPKIYPNTELLSVEVSVCPTKGMVISLMFVHPFKAPSPIEFTVLGITTFSRDERFSKAAAGIVVTALPPMYEGIHIVVLVPLYALTVIADEPL